MPSAEMDRVLAAFRARRDRRVGVEGPSLRELRAGFSPADVVHPVPDDVAVTDVVARGVPSHWLVAPGVDDTRVLLYLHGGGYSLGSLRSHGELAARLGRASGMKVLLVDYRLAPEHPFPAAVDDALSAWHWLCTDERLDASSISVAGDSAGGGLALALLVALRDAGQPLPSAAVLMSPWTDLSGAGDSLHDRAGEDVILSPERVAQLAVNYLNGADPKTPLASPLFATLAGLPRLLVQVGTAEVLLSDSLRLAETATEAKVPVILRVGEGLPHVFPGMPSTPEAHQATEEAGQFLRTT